METETTEISGSRKNLAGRSMEETESEEHLWWNEELRGSLPFESP